MSDEAGFLRALADDSDDDACRLVYADWLEERGDERGEFLRVEHALRYWPPDHAARPFAEDELGHLRGRIDPGWVRLVVRDAGVAFPHSCGCASSGRGAGPTTLHADTQDTSSRPWHRLVAQVGEAIADGRSGFVPFPYRVGSYDSAEDEEEAHRQEVGTVTLPSVIAGLKGVKQLEMYGSFLSRVPPEIGWMTALERLDPYTSYRLHWFRFEITRCPALRGSRVSTRALYGNFKYRLPFPALDAPILDKAARPVPEELPLHHFPAPPDRECSVCRRRFVDRREHRVWISLRVATDVLPLLVNACSQECVRSLPPPAEGYVDRPHRGGPGVVQPPPGYPP